MKISKEVKTAILVISGILLFIFLFNYLQGENLLDNNRIYYATYDNVEGLAPSTPVTINGFNVGTVKDIRFKNDGSGRLEVEMLIDEDFEFSKNSTAQLYDLGLIGGKAIQIIPAFDNAGVAESGTTLKSSNKEGLTELVNKRLTPLQVKIEAVMGDADTLLTNFNEVFDEDTKSNLRNAISELNLAIVGFKSTASALNRLVDGNTEKFSNTMTNFESASKDLSELTAAIDKDDLSTAISDLQSTVDSFDKMMASIENGDGSIGKLLKDEKLYTNLEGASYQLEQLLQDMKLNPKRYVHFSLFGKKPKKYDAEGNELDEKVE